MPAWNQTEAAKIRAAQVWKRLLGSFGDSLIRKFDASPPDEWTEALASLKAPQIERAFRRMRYQGLQAPPSLPAFMRLAREVGDDGEDQVPLAVLALPAPELDKWAIEANHWLLKHIRTQLAKTPRLYGTPASVQVLQNRENVQGLALDYSSVFSRNVQRLVDAKNLWAVDMRDLSRNDAQGRVPMPTARAVWADYVNRAERLAESETPAATPDPA